MEYYKSNDGQKIYLAQFSVVIEDQFLFLPYSAGCLWAYAEYKETVSREQLGGILFIKKPIDDVMRDIDNPSVFGFSHYIWNENYNDTLAKRIKEQYPDCLIIYGGPQVPDKMSEWYDEHYYVDVCVHQEGEIAYNDILSGKQFSDIGGLSYQDNGEWKRTTPSKRIQNLDEIPSPYLMGLFDNLNTEGYILNLIMETDRGCPYKCTFCDWGGINFSKVKRLGLERVFEEIEWVGKNNIEMINCANANFGIFKERDNMIADKLIETHKKYGYPKAFDTSWAKNSNDDVLEIASKLKDAGLLRKFGISMQSLDQQTLKNIKRSNLKINDFSSVIQKAEERGINVMVELIVGLPGETYESWTSNYCYLMQFENTSIENYPCSLLNNSEINSPEAIEEFDIKYKVVDFGSIASHHVSESAKQITGTYSMPEDIVKKVWEWTWCARLGHTVGITNVIVGEMRKEHNISIEDFYKKWYNYIRTSNGILNEKFLEWKDILDDDDFNRYIFDYSYIEDIGHLRRNETLIDIKSFIEENYSEMDASKYVELFDMTYYTPAYSYPYEINGYVVSHKGMGTVKNYAAFIGLNRKNRGWKCGIQKK